MLGYYEGDRLRYAGKVGTSFDRRTLLGMPARLDELSTPERPFADRVREVRSHWVEPVLVAQIAFTEWTRDGVLRHPRFLGLRDDMTARDVVRERPSALTA
ncbi:ATP dependent DNA ligase [Streptomyces mirabilis]